MSAHDVTDFLVLVDKKCGRTDTVSGMMLQVASGPVFTIHQPLTDVTPTIVLNCVQAIVEPYLKNQDTLPCSVCGDTPGKDALRPMVRGHVWSDANKKIQKVEAYYMESCSKSACQEKATGVLTAWWNTVQAQIDAEGNLSTTVVPRQ